MKMKTVIYRKCSNCGNECRLDEYVKYCSKCGKIFTDLLNIKCNPDNIGTRRSTENVDRD